MLGLFRLGVSSVYYEMRDLSFVMMFGCLI